MWITTIVLGAGLLGCHHGATRTPQQAEVVAKVEDEGAATDEGNAQADSAGAMDMAGEAAGADVERLAEKQAMVRLLSGKDATPDCAAVEALTSKPLADLVFIVEQVQQPPWAGMRAAHCVIEGYARLGARNAGAVDNVLRRWVKDPDRVGVGLLVLGELDALPEAIAVTIARDAVHTGPVPDKARERVARAESEAVRGVAQEFPPPARLLGTGWAG